MEKVTQTYISEHKEQELSKLILGNKNDKNVDFDLAFRQISGYQKIKNKVPAFANPIEILYPISLSIEQSSSELTAKYKSTLVEGNTFIDMTGGFGVDFYFLSQKFKQGFFIERQQELCELAKHNFNSLSINNFEILNDNSIEILNTLPESDLIYLDPHRRNSAGNKVFKISDCEPDILAILPELFNKSTKLLIKLSPMLDISSTLNQIPGIREIHIVSVDNECKEILLLIEKDYEADVLIKTVNIPKNSENQLFTFKYEEEKESTNIYADESGKYLFEPNSSIMKAGAFKITGKTFELNKLEQHTHLYTSNVLTDSFPGRIFEILTAYDFNKHTVKLLQKNYSKANISCRNFPLSPDQLKAKLKLSDGGDIYLFACKTRLQGNMIFLCKKI